MGKRCLRSADRLRPLCLRGKSGRDRGGAAALLRGRLTGGRWTMAAIDRQATFSGTKEVSEALRFDLALLEAHLTREVRGFVGPLVARQFKGGQSNPTYLIDTPTRRYVLRRKPPGKLLPSAHAVDREFRVIAALHRQGFPVPEPVIYCDDAQVVGTAFFVMSFVAGRIFWEPHLPGSNAAE